MIKTGFNQREVFRIWRADPKGPIVASSIALYECGHFCHYVWHSNRCCVCNDTVLLGVSGCRICVLSTTGPVAPTTAPTIPTRQRPTP